MVSWINNLWTPPGSARAARTGGWCATTLEHSPAEGCGRDAGWWTSAMARRNHGIPAHPKEHLCHRPDTAQARRAAAQNLVWTGRQNSHGIILNSHKRHSDQQRTGVTCSSRRLYRYLWSEEQRGKEFSWSLIYLISFLAALWHELYRPQERECRNSVAFLWQKELQSISLCG